VNENIKELANKAYGITDAKPFHPSALIHLEKFAELIVLECANIALREEHDPYECIKKHFGVE
jgi:hypothetical protein